MNKDTSTETVIIKKTKSVQMEGNEREVLLIIKGFTTIQSASIPMKSVFQVKRGLESYIQKFYRKQIKK